MIICKREDLERVLKQLWMKIEPRPFNKDNRRDGNFNYIHQQDVADAIVNFMNKFDKEIKLHSPKQGEDFPDDIKEL